MLSRRLLRIKVVKALFAHLKSGADNMMASEKTLMASVDKAYDLYFQILILPVEIARYAEQRQELAKQKKLPTFEDLNPNTKFVDNAVIRTIANSDAVNDHVGRSVGCRCFCCIQGNRRYFQSGESQSFPGKYTLPGRFGRSDETL